MSKNQSEKPRIYTSPRGTESRRSFLKKAGSTAAMTGAGLGAMAGTAEAASSSTSPHPLPERNPITIDRVDFGVEKQPLGTPYGFKGGFVTEGWQTVALLADPNGNRTIGIGKQSPFWADSDLALEHTATGGQSLMMNITDRALQLIQGRTFQDPIKMIEWVYPQVHEYARGISLRQNVSPNFVLDALVPVEFAAWLLYSRVNDISDFVEMIPGNYRNLVNNRTDLMACAPSLSYNSSKEEAIHLAEQGFFVMKIKLGSPGEPEEMLRQDKEQITMLHNTLSQYSTEYTDNGKLAYWFDCNTRYSEAEYLHEFLDHMKSIGAYDQIVVIEEPFPLDAEFRADEFEVPIAADESGVTPESARARMELGYDGVALKPVAKTITMSLKVTDIVNDYGGQCFCSDLTVNPTLREWNKIFGARLGEWPGVGMGMLESNGFQYYANWEEMQSWHPYPDASWAMPQDGVFKLNDDYYEKSGGIFTLPEHYLRIVEYQQDE